MTMTIDTSPSKAPDFESRHMDDVATGERIYAAGLPMSHCECSDQEYGWEGAADDADDLRLEKFDQQLAARIHAAKRAQP